MSLIPSNQKRPDCLKSGVFWMTGVKLYTVPMQCMGCSVGRKEANCRIRRTWPAILFWTCLDKYSNYLR